MKICRRFVHWYRDIYNKFRAKKLLNQPCIISRDCIGGVLYSDYNLKFTSPTIDLELMNDDFILFCNNLRDYLKTELEEVHCDKNYPVGKLTNIYGTVHIYFRHYNTFKEAKECWDRRKTRVDYNNIYVIMCIGPNGNENVIKKFQTIKFKNKILLSSNINLKKYSNCFNMKCYEKGYKDSLIQHLSRYSLKRYLDEFNWIKFFNNKEK